MAVREPPVLGGNGELCRGSNVNWTAGSREPALAPLVSTEARSSFLLAPSKIRKDECIPGENCACRLPIVSC
jgi:hypothetical protein